MWFLKRCWIYSGKDCGFGCEMAIERVLQGFSMGISGGLSYLLCISDSVDGHF